MIRLAHADGWLEFKTVGPPYSGNGWCLNVDAIVYYPQGEWRFRGDFCRMDDLEALADWFDAVAAGEKPEMVMVGGFMYPVFVFHVHGGGHNINSYEESFSPCGPGVFRVTMGAWPRPYWLPWTCSRDEPAFLDFPIVASHLSVAAAELRKQLRLLQ